MTSAPVRTPSSARARRTPSSRRSTPGKTPAPQMSFTKEQKHRLRDSGLKFHLVQTGQRCVRAISDQGDQACGQNRQRGDFACDLQSLPCPTAPLRAAGGSRCQGMHYHAARRRPNQVRQRRLSNGQFIIVKGDQAYVADSDRKKIAELSLDHAAVLPAGESKIGVSFPAEDGSTKVGIRYDGMGSRQRRGRGKTRAVMPANICDPPDPPQSYGYRVYGPGFHGHDAARRLHSAGSGICRCHG